MDNVVESVYSQMTELISSGQWKASSKIPTEHELAETFHASRNSIRQAMSQLKALGLIESKRGYGTVIKKQVAPLTLNDIIPSIMFEIEDNLQIFEFHKGIQIECVKLACLRYTDEQLSRFIYHTDQLKENYAKGDMVNAIFHDLACHKIICEMSGNLVFVRASEIIYQRLEQSFTLISSSFEYKESIIFHERLISALQARNVSFAAAIMEGHQWDTYQKFLSLTGQERK